MNIVRLKINIDKPEVKVTFSDNVSILGEKTPVLKVQLPCIELYQSSDKGKEENDDSNDE